MDTIKIACWRATPQYAQTPSAELAKLITAQRYIKRMTLIEFFAECVARGASTADLKQIYQFGQYKLDVQYILEQSGDYVDLASIQAMIALMPFDVASQTSVAIAATISAHTARLVDVVAAELGEVAPESVSVADVDEALGR